MTQTSPSHRWLAILGTIGIFSVVIGAISYHESNLPSTAEKTEARDITARDPKTWPLFGGSLSRNLVNTVDKDIPQDFDVAKGKAGNIKWSVNLGSKAYGGPIISGGKIFIGTNNGQPRDAKLKGDKGVMMCFEEATGKFLWQHVYDKLAAGRVNDWPEEGICSSPVVEGDLMYYVNNRSEVICSKTDDTLVWKLDMIKKFNNFPHNLSTCSPLVVGDTLFVITSNGVDEGHINIPQPTAPSFLALDKTNGNVKWSSNLPTANLLKPGAAAAIGKLKDSGQILMHGQWANPVYAEPNGKPVIIFPGGDGWIRGFDPADGKLQWAFDCNPKSSFYVLGPRATRNDFVSTPVVWDNKLYIGVGQDPEHLKGVGHLWCIDLIQAQEKGAKNANHDVSPWPDPAVSPAFDPKDPRNKDAAFIWHFGGDNPTKKPRPYHFGRTMSTCCIHDGLLYEAEFDGWLHCLDAKTGELKWQHRMDADTWSSPYYVDGKIHIGNENGQLLIFKAGAKKELLNTIEMATDSATMVRATPVVVNGVLYVMTENPCKLHAITPGGK
jgi:outer membrane protein assembly factor BamB